VGRDVAAISVLRRLVFYGTLRPPSHVRMHELLYRPVAEGDEQELQALHDACLPIMCVCVQPLTG